MTPSLYSRWACALALVLGLAQPRVAASASGVPPQRPAVAASVPGVSAVVDPAGQLRLDELVARLPAASADERQRLLAGLRSDDTSVLPLYAERVTRPLTSRPALTQRLLHAIWAQVPNPDYPRGPGKDPPMWFVRPEPPPPPLPPAVPGMPRPKRVKIPPHDPEAVDWLTALATLRIEEDPFLAELRGPALQAAHAELLLRVALLAALSHLGRDGQREAILPIFQAAFISDGLLRDQCGKTLRGLGSPVIPTLYRLYRDREHVGFKMRRYAAYQLDRMDRMLPRKALSTAPDDRLRAEILHVYGEVLATEAVEAVLELVGTVSHRVRREARWAWLRFVDGPAPPPAPKRKRKLPGGKEEAEEKDDYLTYRDLAVLTLHRVYRTLFARPPAPSATPRQLSDEIFSHYDRQRAQKFQQILTAGQSLERSGDLAGAVSQYLTILAGEPEYEQRSALAPAFAQHGQALAGQAERTGDQAILGRALGYLRVSLLLSPAQPEATALRALIQRLDDRAGQTLRVSDPSARLPGSALPARAPSVRRGSPLPYWVLCAAGVVCGLLALFMRRRAVPPAVSLVALSLGPLLGLCACLVPIPLTTEGQSDANAELLVLSAQPAFGTVRATDILDPFRFQIDIQSSTSNVASRLYAQMSGDCCDLQVEDFNVTRFQQHADLSPIGTTADRYTLDFRQTFPPCSLGFSGKIGYLVPVIAVGGFADGRSGFRPDAVGLVDRGHYWTIVCP